MSAAAPAGSSTSGGVSAGNAGAAPAEAEPVTSTTEADQEEDETDDEPDGQDHKKRRRKSSVGDGEGTQRVQLACFYCRVKRIRCSGVKPICSACVKASVPCEWPSGRRKKRTRKEMEEAKRAEAVLNVETGVAGPGVAGDAPSSSGLDANFQADLGSSSGSAVPWGLGQMMGGDGSNNDTFDPNTFAGSSNFVWPSGFTPENQPFSLSMPDLSEPTMAQFMGNFINTPGNGSGSTDQLGGNGAGTSSAAVMAGGNGQPGLPGSFGVTGGFGFNTSPGTDMRLLNALENQAAYIEGNPAEDKDLELYYYRFSGSTAISPGVSRISLKLQRRAVGESPLSAAPRAEADDSRPETPIPRPLPQDIHDEAGMPHDRVWQPLFHLFYTHVSQYFPSVSKQRMIERFETGTMSQFLANCICALGARFDPASKSNPTAAAAPFIAKAQELIIPLLHLPAYDVVTGLMLLSWSNYGQSSESGLWQYSGMAIRMAIDIGVHENSEIFESPAHRVRTRLLFWSLFVTDRIIAFATGRPASIPEDIVEVPLPEDQDFFPDPARNTPADPVEPVEPVPFVYFVKLMIICGRISNVLNGRRGKARTLVNADEPLSEQMAELQMRLVQFVAGLPDSLRWSVDNFKHQQARGHGGMFLGLHLWAHAVLALIYHPELLKSPSGMETPLNMNMSRNVKLSLASSRQICECMVFADLVSQDTYTSAPYIVQPLYVAAMAFIHEMRSAQAATSSDTQTSSNPTDLFLMSISRQNFSAILNALVKMEQYWAGANYVVNILEKRSGITRPRSKGANKKTFISLPDKGMLKRFTADPAHPNNITAPTETSMRDSMVKPLTGGPSPYWLADLMAGYTVQNTSVAPADNFDLERLLASGGFGNFAFSPNQGLNLNMSYGGGQRQQQQQQQQQQTPGPLSGQGDPGSAGGGLGK